MGLANNVQIQKRNRAKTADIPFTIVGTGTASAAIASVDGPLAAAVEVFIAISESASQDGQLGGAGGSKASTLDPSANDTNSKAFAGNLSQAAPASIGFIILDGGGSPLQNMTAPGGDPSNPGYPTVSGGSTATIGTAQQVFSAFAEITDGTGAPIVGAAALLDKTVTPNGNVKVKVTFPGFYPSAATPTNTVFTLKTNETKHGVLHLSWF